MIDMYDPVIYPRMFWVATEWDDSIPKRFIWKDGVSPLAPPNGAFAETYEVMRKSDGLYGVLTVFCQLKGLGGRKLLNHITHECIHAASFFMKELGIEADTANDEPMAYIGGWTAECCWRTIEKVIYAKKDEQK